MDHRRGRRRPRLVNTINHLREVAEKHGDMANLVQTISDEVESMDQDDNEIGTRLDEILRNLNTMQRDNANNWDRMRNDITAAVRQDVQGIVHEEMADMRKEMAAERYNDICRINNRSVHSSDQQIDKFHHVVTNEEIPGFPDILADVTRLTEVQLDAILMAIGLNAAGEVNSKRERLLWHTGLKRTHIPS